MNKIVIISLCFWVFCPSLFAQVEDEVDVYTGFKPQLADVEKFYEQPAIKDTFQKKPIKSYKLETIPVEAQFKTDSIEPAKMESEPLEPLQRFYLKAGFGNYLSPYVEAIINSKRHRSDSYVLYYKHFSSGGKISKRGFPGISDNIGRANYSHYFRNHTISITGNFVRKVVHYYGFEPLSDSAFDNTPRQRFVGGSANVDFYTSAESVKKLLNHKHNASFYYLKDLYGTREWNTGLTGNINTYTNWFANDFLGGELKAQYFNLKSDSFPDNLSSFFINAKPYLKMGDDVWHLKIGANLFFAFGNQFNFNIYPDVDLLLKFYKNHVMLFGRLGGNFQRNTYRRLTRINPFVNPNVEIKNTNKQLTGALGFKGAITDAISYALGGSFALTKNTPFFVADTSVNRSYFNVIYSNSNNYRLFAELSYTLGKKLSVAGKMNYYLYQQGKILSPYHRPFMDGTIEGRYNLGNKLFFSLDFYFISPQTIRTFKENPNVPGLFYEDPDRIPGTVDLNVGAEYRLRKWISFWVNFNNIAAFRFQRWYGYPTQQFNVLGGIKLAL